MATPMATPTATATATPTSPHEVAPLDGAYSRVAWRLVPFLMVLWIIAWIDRVNVGFAKLEMLSDLKFSEAVYGLGAGIFFIGYFLFEVPSNLLMMRIGARKTIARITIGWGVTSMLMAFVTTPAMFYFLRFLLGVFEAGFYPGVILYLTYWFPTARRAKAFGFFMSASALAGVIGGPMAGAIMSGLHRAGGFAGWQWVFIIEGIPSLIAGVATLFYLTDRPAAATWLTPAQRDAIEADLARDAAALGPREHSFASALKSVRVWQFIAIFFCIILANSTLTFWGPSVVRDLGYASPLAVGWVMAGVYAVGAAGMILNGIHSDKTGESRLHCGIAATIGGVGLIGLALLGSSGSLAALACLVAAVAGTMSAIPVFWQMPNQFLGGAAAAAGIALINSVANLAGFGAPALIGYVKDATGSTTLGLAFVGACEILTLLLILVFVPARRVLMPPTAEPEPA